MLCIRGAAMDPSKIGPEEARNLLSNCFLFRSLQAEERAAIVSRARTSTFKPGETVFSMGSPGDNMMAVLSGTVRISVPAPDGREIMLAILQPGEVFGELAVLDGKDRSADAVADSLCTLAILSRRDVLSFLEHNPAVWPKLVTVLCERLRGADQLLGEVALLQLPVRLAKALLRIVRNEPKSKTGAKTSRIRFSQRELANMVGGTRESVNKCLAAWQRQGVIRISEGKIIILNKTALEDISGLD
jgi:CRP/FNR family cyclic AMP-dependent transcriptional regulator